MIIAILQAVNIFQYWFTFYPFCDSWHLDLLANSLVTKDSEVSKLLGGWYLLPLSKVALSGAFDIHAAVAYHITLYIELLLTVILRVDIVNTIRNPLKRGKNL